MKKIINSILNFFDKIFVVPMTKLVYKLRNSFSSSNWRFEAWLSKSNTLLYISLAVAIILSVAVNQKLLVYSENNAIVLHDQPVEVKYNEEAYVVEGLPSTVEVTLIGNSSNLYWAKQSNTHKITINLNDLKPGQHKVDVIYENVLKNIDYSVNPSTVTVWIYPKVSATKSLTYDLLHIDELDKRLNVDSVTLDADQVVIKGSEEQISKVANVKALIDVNNFDTQNVGEMVIKNVPIKAYDANGNVVNVEIVPEKVNANIEISSPSKEVPIKIIPVGTVTFGKAISAIDTSVVRVTAYGSAEALADLEYIPIEVDVSNLSSGVDKKIEIPKPSGVNSLSSNNLTVKISIASSTSRDVDKVPVNARNVGEGLAVNITSNAFISVSVSGVESVIENLQPSDITAYVDCSGLKEGEYDLDIKVEGSDLKATYTPKTLKVKVTITTKK